MTPERDVILHCVSCGCDFNWTARAQATYAREQWAPPKRCYDCRQRERERRQQQREHAGHGEP